MSRVGDLIDNYEAELRLPWRSGLSPAERVWMLVYPPEEERRVRVRLDDLAHRTHSADKGWLSVDLTDTFGQWLAGHEYAETFVTDPSDLTSSVLEEFEEHTAELVRSALTATEVDDATVVAIVGTGALFPFMRASRLVESVDDAVRGRLLVLFPGRVERATNTYRLLDARDGFNYRARPITHEKEPS